jgi:hypothetical protein
VLGTVKEDDIPKNSKVDRVFLLIKSQDFVT